MVVLAVIHLLDFRLMKMFSVLQEQEELKQRERQKRRRRMENISTLTELGFSRREAARALHRADGDVDRASGVGIWPS